MSTQDETTRKATLRDAVDNFMRHQVTGTRVAMTALQQLVDAADAASDDAEIGRQWSENSSLEKWFPITAEELSCLREQLACVVQALPEPLRGMVPSVAVATLAAGWRADRNAEESQ